MTLLPSQSEPSDPGPPYRAGTGEAHRGGAGRVAELEKMITLFYLRSTLGPPDQTEVATLTPTFCTSPANHPARPAKAALIAAAAQTRSGRKLRPMRLATRRIHIN